MKDNAVPPRHGTILVDAPAKSINLLNSTNSTASLLSFETPRLASQNSRIWFEAVATTENKVGNHLDS